jgi:hypothetical protein
VYDIAPRTVEYWCAGKNPPTQSKQIMLIYAVFSDLQII